MAFFNDLTGTLLDRRYQINGLLGKGGMGHVYDAVHVALEQRVAIKVLHPRYATEERFRERFIREARSASRIQHRNVVRITDFGDTPDGSVYFVMELLEGHDVGEELRAGAMPWSRARHILLQAVGALRAAHAKDIVHRDIKPANCFLTVDNEEGTVDFVKLLDFGIAKVGSDSHVDAQGKGLTGTGEVFGTAAYMAPEQAKGSDLDARSDMYSLGIMAYEMLTGGVPFTGVNSIHVITKHLNEPPVPPRTHEPSIPAEVEALVLKMIAKEASRRYDSMTALEQAMRAIPESAGTPVRRTQIWGGASSEATDPGAKPGAKTSERTAVVSPRVGAPGGGAGVGQKRSIIGGAQVGAAGGGDRAPVQATPVGRDRSGPPASAGPRAPVAGAGARALPGAVGGARPPVSAKPSPVSPVAPGRSPVAGSSAPAVAGARALPGHRDPSVPPPGAVAEPVRGARDRSMPPPGAVAEPVRGARDRSAPPPGVMSPPGGGRRDPSVPPPGAMSPPGGGRRDPSVPPPGAMAQPLPGARDPSVPPPGAMAPPLPGRDPSVPPGPVAQALPGHHDRAAPPPSANYYEGTNPPPGGRDRSVPPPSTWSSSASSTGPLARTGDSSAETSPQSLQVVASPAITGRMIAVVGLLVILVGGGSALGTMAFLQGQGAVAPAAVQAAAPEVVVPVVPAPSEVAAAAMTKDEPVEHGAGAVVPADDDASTGPSPSAGVVVDAEPNSDEGEASGEGGTTGGAAVPSEGHEPGSTSADSTNGEDEGEEEIGAVGEPSTAKPSSSSAAGVAAGARKRPKHETAECVKVREGARTALEAMAWGKLLDLTRRTWCWSAAEALQRKRWNVQALAEQNRNAECVKVGGSANDSMIKTMVAACKKKLAK